MSHVCLAQELLLDLYSNLITFVCMFQDLSLRLYIDLYIQIAICNKEICC